MHRLRRYRQEIQLTLLLLACSLVGGYVGGRLALHQAASERAADLPGARPELPHTEVGRSCGQPMKTPWADRPGLQGSYIL